MNISEIIILAFIVAAVALAVFFLVRSRKKGNQCAGCSGCADSCSKMEGCTGEHQQHPGK